MTEVLTKSANTIIKIPKKTCKEKLVFYFLISSLVVLSVSTKNRFLFKNTFRKV